LKKNVFVLGGCRSGKSRYALETAQTYPGNHKVFIATCVPRDDEMKQRVARHQAERSPAWKTVEAPLQLPEAIAECSREDRTIVVDCLTLWISNLLLEFSDVEMIERSITRLTAAIERSHGPVILVSNEVGNGIVPENELARKFRDLVGSVNQAVAGCVDSVVWVVAGIPVTIKDKGQGSGFKSSGVQGLD
jgi:adenosylcobinamide kinase/adenosylcobinamide-phosphate guanylyltransferase